MPYPMAMIEIGDFQACHKHGSLEHGPEPEACVSVDLNPKQYVMITLNAFGEITVSPRVLLDVTDIKQLADMDELMRQEAMRLLTE